VRGLQPQASRGIILQLLLACGFTKTIDGLLLLLPLPAAARLACRRLRGAAAYSMPLIFFSTSL
jgi:hypothetical protein